MRPESLCVWAPSIGILQVRVLQLHIIEQQLLQRNQRGRNSSGRYAVHPWPGVFVSGGLVLYTSKTPPRHQKKEKEDKKGEELGPPAPLLFHFCTASHAHLFLMAPSSFSPCSSSSKSHSSSSRQYQWLPTSPWNAKKRKEVGGRLHLESCRCLEKVL